MARALTLTIFAAALAVAAMASDVIDATDDSFDDVTKSGDVVLVEFYAPWCGHCKKLAPEWEEAATTLKGMGAKAVLAKVDATEQRKIAETMEIRGYPTIKIFRDGAAAGEYDGGRDAAGIVKWVQANSGPSITVLASAEQLAEIKKESAVVVAFFNSGAADSDEFKAFSAVAGKLRSQFRFVSTTDAAVFPAGKAGKIVAYKQFDDPEEEYTGEAIATDAIGAFVQAAGVRIFDEMGPDNYKGYIDRGLPISWLFVSPEELTGALTDTMTTLAKELKGKISIVWIDSGKYGGMASRLGLSGSKFPAVAVDHKDVHHTFSEGEPIELEALRTFYTRYLADELTATVRTEVAPAEHTVEGLTTVVGTTFDELLTTGDVDVVVEFYAPWCGHCKKLAPEWKKVAKSTEKVEGLRVAQFDASSNDFDKAAFDVAGFPTIFFVPKGSPKSPVLYEGERTAAAILAFLKDKSSANFATATSDEL